MARVKDPILKLPVASINRIAAISESTSKAINDRFESSPLQSKADVNKFVGYAKKQLTASYNRIIKIARPAARKSWDEAGKFARRELEKSGYTEGRKFNAEMAFKEEFSKTVSEYRAANKSALDSCQQAANRVLSLYRPNIAKLQNERAAWDLIKRGARRLSKKALEVKDRTTLAGYPYRATDSLYELNKKIRLEYLNKIGKDIVEVTMNLKRGGTKKMKLKHHQKMVTRTEFRRVQSQRVLGDCKSHSCNLVMVSDHGDECPICRPYENQVYRVGKGNEAYPLKPISMPIHPNCRHNWIPTSPARVELDKRRGRKFPKRYTKTATQTMEDLKKQRRQRRKIQSQRLYRNNTTQGTPRRLVWSMAAPGQGFILTFPDRDAVCGCGGDHA